MFTWLNKALVFLGVHVHVPGAKISMVKEVRDIINADGTTTVLVEYVARPEFAEVHNFAVGISFTIIF